MFCSVVRRPLRLFANESGVGDGGMERDYEDGDDGSTIEEEKEQSLVHTAIGAQGDTVSLLCFLNVLIVHIILHPYLRRLNRVIGSDEPRRLHKSRREDV